MPKRKRASKYDRYDIDELLIFIANRYVKFSKHSKKSLHRDKNFLIGQLERADKQWTFPNFLRLPAELRLWVYRELLNNCQPNGERPRCWPQIISVSKFIRQEAEPVLYEENVFTMKMYPCNMGLGTTYALDGVSDFHVNKQTRTLRHCFIDFGAHLQRIRHLQINVNVDKPLQGIVFKADEKTYMPIHYYLYALCSLLAAKNNLRTFELHFDGSKQNISLIKSRLLWPLCKLRNADILHITGIPNNTVEKILQRVRASKVAQVNCIGQGIKMLKRADSIRNLVKEAALTDLDDTELLAKATYPLLAIVDNDDYMDGVQDQYIERCNKELRAFLEGPVPGMITAEARVKVHRLQYLIEHLE